MTRPRQSALDVFISELEEFDGVNETLAGRKRLLRVLKQARKDKAVLRELTEYLRETDSYYLVEEAKERATMEKK